MSLHTWQNLTSDGRVRWLKYSFGPGTANTLAVQLDDASWLVVSPSVGSPDAVYDALASQGPVGALLAPNGFHHMGQKDWRKRFPRAISFAPDDAHSRLAAKSPGIPYKSFTDLKKILPSRIGLLLPDGMKKPDLLLHANTGGETVWFSGDLVSNTGAEDMPLVWRLLMSLFGAGTGFRFNPMPSMVYVNDKSSWKRSVSAAIDKFPPKVVLPAHGDPIRENAAGRTQDILRR